MKKQIARCAAVAMVSAAVTAGCLGSGAGLKTSPRPGAATPADYRTTPLFPVTLTDDAGHRVTVRTQPHRIASVTEGTDEILSALVPKKDVVLVTTQATNPTYSNVVRWAKGIPAIAQADAERIVAAKPDLALLASYTTPGVLSQVKQAGIPAYEFGDFNSIADVEHNIVVVGKLVGQPERARAVVADMEAKLARLQAAAKRHKPLTVLDYSSYGYVAGKGTTVNDIIVRAGARNAAAAVNGWQKVTDEQVVKMNPDVIIDSSDDKGFVAKLMNNPALSTVSAIRNHRVYLIKSADLSSVSQYIVNAVRDLERVLYPGVKLPS
ncbi:MAG: ABC transporter substrate-binding protein [Alicyclobacillaceae bacterium]|nr:ABC transporter substrate-binding protein [Alicyclobacillaceae bacterium]